MVDARLLLPNDPAIGRRPAFTRPKYGYAEFNPLYVLHHLSIPLSVFGTEDFIIRTEQILESGIKVESSVFAM